MINKVKILNSKVNIISLQKTLNVIDKWITVQDIKKYICLFNVHMCMEAYDSNDFHNVVDSADLVLADGFPIYFGQKLMGYSDAEHIRGVDLTVQLSNFSQKKNIPIGFLGGRKNTLTNMCDIFKRKYNVDTINYSYSPPFGQWTDEEKKNMINDINKSEIKILFVGLGCPKQEYWMYNNKDKLNCIMIGVGAAFDFIAGNKKSAPLWIQKIGFEWLFRFISEPKRLWQRYLKHNPRFLYYFMLQYFSSKRR